MRFDLRRWLVGVVCMAVAMGPAAVAQQPQLPGPSPEEVSGNSAMAERLAQMAQMSLGGSKTIAPAMLRHSAALLEAACRLNPAEPRFPHLLTEAYLQLGGEEGRAGAIASLGRYLSLCPDDVPAQIQLIDLHLSQMQTADQRMKYLDQIRGTEQLSPQVRAHAAVVAAQLAAERSASEQSRRFVAEALKLHPLSPEALQMQYQQLPPDASPVERAKVLLAMLRSNPAQPGAMTELAGVLADGGLVDPALQWFTLGFGLAQRMSLAADLGQFTAYAAELVIADQLKQAEDFVQKLLQRDATNADAAFLGLLIARRGGNAQAISAAADQVRAALLTRLSQTGKALAGEAVAPTTQPSTDVNIEADVKQIQQTGDTELGSIYASGLADLAWLEIYFNQKPADAQPYLAALRQILPGDSGTIARLEGWSYLVEGKLEEAKVKLSAVAERDPLARLGILKIESRDPAAAESITVAARNLLMEHSSGLLGAMLIEALRDRVGLMPISPVGAQLRAELDQFPKDWLDLLDLSRASRFYNLKAETAKVSHGYGEPMIATVTITNLSSYDLTIGPNGAIRPDLWVDVQIKGLAQQFIAGVAYERMGKQVLLKPKQSISQSLRIDQGPLAVLMTRNPQVELPLFFSIVTNPLSQQGGIAPGPCGQRQQFLKVVTRAAAPLSPQNVQAQIARLLAGTAEERIRTLELLGTFAAALRGQNDANLQGTATEITDVIRKSTGDRVPAVRGAAMFVTAQLADAAVREGILRQMLIDEQFPIRVTGLAAIQMLEPAKRKELAATVVHSDGDEVVRKLAASVIEVADLPPPSTQPQEQPADSATQPTASGTP